MRNIEHEYPYSNNLVGKARLARDYAKRGKDSYSDYGVGAALTIEIAPEWTSEFVTYAAHNINLSGMQVKAHAEQLALFQMVLDIESSEPANVYDDLYAGLKHHERKSAIKENLSVDSMIVATTENDLALSCGHCLQVTHSVCQLYNCDPSDVAYTAVAFDDNNNLFTDKQTLTDLLPDTYSDA